MRKFIENQVGLVIFLGALLGFMVPGLSSIPSGYLLLIVASVIYLSCYNIKGLDYKSLSVGQIARFYVLRYLVLPFLTFYIVAILNKELAISITLLFLLPAGVSSPALSNIYGGNVALGLVLCLLTHALCPLLIPFVSQYTAGTLLSIDIAAMFLTLLITIVSPVLAFILTRKIRPVYKFCTNYNKLASVLLISAIGFAVIGMQKQMFLEKLPELPVLVLLTSLGMGSLFVYAWNIERQRPQRDRITYTIVSGFNNTALGVGVALLYFPPQTAFFVLVAEVPWCIAPIFFTLFIKRLNRSV